MKEFFENLLYSAAAAAGMVLGGGTALFLLAFVVAAIKVFVLEQP